MKKKIYIACKILAVISLFIGILRLIIPIPFDGCWSGHSLMGFHCCDAHAYLEASKGQIMYYHGEDKPKFIGSYEKTGWNLYEFHNSKGEFAGDLVSGWIFSRWNLKNEEKPNRLGHRDYSFVNYIEYLILPLLIRLDQQSRKSQSANKDSNRNSTYNSMPKVKRFMHNIDSDSLRVDTENNNIKQTTTDEQFTRKSRKFKEIPSEAQQIDSPHQL